MFGLIKGMAKFVMADVIKPMLNLFGIGGNKTSTPIRLPPWHRELARKRRDVKNKRGWLGQRWIKALKPGRCLAVRGWFRVASSQERRREANQRLMTLLSKWIEKARKHEAN